MSTSEEGLPVIEVCTGRGIQEQGNNHASRASVILLHGLGADGHDFVPVVHQLSLPSDLDVRFIFPNAPIQTVTLNGGMQMPAWYDLYGLTLETKEDEFGIRASAEAINRLIAREVSRGIDANRIILAGFSQGGAIALHVGLRQENPLAGIMALSTYLPLRHTLAGECDSSRSPRSIFFAHGTQDDVLDHSMGKQAFNLLKEYGYTTEWHDYPMGHGVCPNEIHDIREWMLGVLTI